MDDPTRHDSNCIVEIISLGLERVSEICRRQNRKMPRTLLVLADNTVRETKNQYVFSYINNLVAQRKMRLAGCMFLRKSHTHGRIDQVWGVLARRISNCDWTQTTPSKWFVMSCPGRDSGHGLDPTWSCMCKSLTQCGIGNKSGSRKASV